MAITLSLSLHVDGHVPGGPGTRMSPFWILSELMATEMVVTTGAIRHAKRQWKCHHKQTNIQFFYRPDALPIAKWTVSKHWRENHLHGTTDTQEMVPTYTVILRYYYYTFSVSEAGSFVHFSRYYSRSGGAGYE